MEITVVDTETMTSRQALVITAFAGAFALFAFTDGAAMVFIENVIASLPI